MERDALVIRNFALDVVKHMSGLTCGYDLGEQVQRAGTALHLFFSELFDAGESGQERVHAENALRVALEFRAMKEYSEIPAIDRQRTELLIFTLRTYRSGGGKFRKFASQNEGGIK